MLFTKTELAKLSSAERAKLKRLLPDLCFDTHGNAVSALANKVLKGKQPFSLADVQIAIAKLKRKASEPVVIKPKTVSEIINRLHSHKQALELGVHVARVRRAANALAR